MTVIRNALLLMVIVALSVTTVLAIATTTSVRFNIPTNVAFTVTLPSQTAVNATGAIAATAAIDINSSDGNSKYVDPCVTGGACQTTSTAILQYDNTGTVSINISISTDVNLSSCIVFWEASSYANLNTSGTDILNALVRNTTIVNITGPGSAVTNVFLSANFTNCAPGNSTTVVLTSYGFQS